MRSLRWVWKGSSWWIGYRCRISLCRSKIWKTWISNWGSPAQNKKSMMFNCRYRSLRLKTRCKMWWLRCQRANLFRRMKQLLLCSRWAIQAGRKRRSRTKTATKRSLTKNRFWKKCQRGCKLLLRAILKKRTIRPFQWNPKFSNTSSSKMSNNK